MNPFDNLPDELICLISSFCTSGSFCRLRLTCKRFAFLLDEKAIDELIERTQILKIFKDTFTDSHFELYFEKFKFVCIDTLIQGKRDESYKLVKGNYVYNSFKRDPALKIVNKDKSKQLIWYKNGLIHRDKGPAFYGKFKDLFALIDTDNLFYLRFNYGEDNCIAFFRNGKLSRSKKPAIIIGDSVCIWAQDGKIHRGKDKPAVKCEHNLHWYKNGQLHRDKDRPSIKYLDRSEWYRHGKAHRDNDKPAFISAREIRWYFDGECYRENGPYEIGLKTIQWKNYRVDLINTKLSRMFFTCLRLYYYFTMGYVGEPASKHILTNSFLIILALIFPITTLFIYYGILTFLLARRLLGDRPFVFGSHIETVMYIILSIQLLLYLCR